MENGYFFTGFPGFICNQLIREVLKRNQLKGKAYVLVLPQMTAKAEAERRTILSELQLADNQFEIITGDITKSQLEISKEQQSTLFEKVTHVYHLAAIYDLAVPREIAYKVNVKGTENVCEWAENLLNIQRMTYFSTAYIAGTREGTLYENELIPPPSFKNYYEETKYKAEIVVEKLKEILPVTIIRPGIVKGHSQTGETIKFDGPYFFLNFLDRLRFLPVIPRLGQSGAVINLVPIDYIIQATAYLSFLPEGEGKTYHLTDPHPYLVSQIYEMFMKELLKKEPKGTLPLGAAKWSLSLKPIRKFLGVEKEALDYFTWMGQFDCTQAQSDLMGSDIRCPDFKVGVPAMVDFYIKNKENPNYQLKII